MCLYIDKEKTRKWKKTGKITVYKRLVYRDYSLNTPATLTKVPKTGLLKSRRQKQLKSFEVERGEVTYGIHVYYNKEQGLHTINHWGGRLYECTADKKDLVAVGKDGEAVFTKIQIHLDKQIA